MTAQLNREIQSTEIYLGIMVILVFMSYVVMCLVSIVNRNNL